MVSLVTYIICNCPDVDTLWNFVNGDQNINIWHPKKIFSQLSEWPNTKNRWPRWLNWKPLIIEGKSLRICDEWVSQSLNHFSTSFLQSHILLVCIVEFVFDGILPGMLSILWTVFKLFFLDDGISEFQMNPGFYYPRSP